MPADVFYAGPVGGTRKVTGLYFDPELTKSGVTYTTGATGTAGYGGGEAGAAPAAGMILGPWAPDESSEGRGGETTAAEEGDDCCCCCCPCDCSQTTYSRGNTITSSPVEASRATAGLVITGGPAPSGSGPGGMTRTNSPGMSQQLVVRPPGYEPGRSTYAQPVPSGPLPGGMTQAMRSAMTQPQVAAVPGYQGPLSTYAQATTASQKGGPCCCNGGGQQPSGGDCGCGCGGGGKSAPSPGTFALPAIPSATAGSPAPVMDADVFDIAPVRASSVLARTILAGPTDGEKFASFSRDLLADVLTVSGAGAGMPPAGPVPGATTIAAAAGRTTPSRASGAAILAAAARPESAAVLRRTISG